ncbi:MAG: peptidylprolyl isomerase [Nostocales cyanobacterium]|nr:MAG: peptidylprolyl isomerase [Nostocales cyanobacterium]
MSQILNITNTDIIHNIKLSCQIPDVIKAIASQKIITDIAQELGITVTPEELQQQGDKLRLEKKLVKAKDTWNWLEKYHLSVDDFEEIAYHQILMIKLANHLFSDQVEKFFYAHKVDYLCAVTYQVMFDNLDLALEMFYSLQEEEISFPEVAYLYLEDSEERRVYGYQGIQYRKDFRPEIAAAVFATTPPQVIKPITTTKGVHLILVEEIIEPKLDEFLHNKIINELFSDWLQKQVSDLGIVTQISDQDELPLQESLLQSTVNQ